MAKKDTSVIYIRMEKELRNNAENILEQLGITPSAAIHMLYRKIILTNSFPLDLKLPANSATENTNEYINSVKSETYKKIENPVDTTKEIKKEKSKESSDKTDTETTKNSATPVYRPDMPFIVKPKRKD